MEMMKYGAKASFMWVYLGLAGCKYLSQTYGLAMGDLKKQVKAQYLAIMARTEDIPGCPNQANLYFGALVLAFAKSYDFVSHDDLTKIILLMFRIPNKLGFLKKHFKVMNFLSKKKPYQSDYKNDWASYVLTDQAPRELRLIYTKCGLHSLCIQEGMEEVLPLMCLTDYLSYEGTDVDLLRTKTLANSDCCEFRFINKDLSSREEVMKEEGIRKEDLL